MVNVIDKKLDEKIKNQLQEINNLQATINKLKQGNNEVRAHPIFKQIMRRHRS